MDYRIPEKIGDYFVERTLGSGSCGKVKLARDDQGNLYAIKVIKKSIFETKPELKGKIQREVAIMKIFKHSRLLKLIEICESTHHIYLVLEYASNGELFDFLVTRKFLPENEAMHFFRQIIYGLDFLHSHSVCHRDLKPENILLDEFNNIKIADFGFARLMNSNVLDTYCGSVHYAAPEIIAGIPYNGRPADIWSCGVILYTLLVGRLPFNDHSIRVTMGKIRAGHYIMPDSLSDDVKKLIAGMLQVDPTTRLTCKEIKESNAFRIGLPDDYVLPSPLPVPNYHNAVDPETVDATTMGTLMQLGFSEDEITEQLVMEGSSPVKVMYHLMENQANYDSIPWSASEYQSIRYEDTPQFHPQAFGFNANIDSFGRRRRGSTPGVSSPGVYSLVEISRWGNLGQPMCTNEIEQPIVDLAVELEPLVASIQRLLDTLSFEWFYPDDVTIIARPPESDGTLLASIIDQARGLKTLTLTFRNMEGTEITTVVEAIMEMLNELC